MILQKVKSGDKRALARAITEVERQTQEGKKILQQLSGPLRAHIIGVTGPSGAGKSTILSHLVEGFASEDKKVAVLAVDPSSPFSGGALLGDRLRMSRVALNPNVFIRSIGSRGHHGGLCPLALNIISLMDQGGYEIIFVETVGVGQAEVEVMNVADTVLVVLTPDYGDEVQTMKAGLLEIASVFAVNKADKLDAGSFARELETMIEMAERPDGWKPPVIITSAIRGEGVKEVIEALTGHFDYLKKSGLLTKKRLERRMGEFVKEVTEELSRKIQSLLLTDHFNDVRQMLENNEPFSAVKEKFINKLKEVNHATEKLFD